MLKFDLAYIWIKSYNNIEEQGFSFGGKFNFTFNKAENSISYTINPEYDVNFFNACDTETSCGKISSVTAIVGSNGSGKSSILEFYCSLLRFKDGIERTIKIDEDLIIFESTNYFFVYTQNKVKKFFNMGTSDGSFDLNNPDETLLQKHDIAFSQLIIPIFYSTSWSDNITKLHSREWELINISNSNFYYNSHFIPVVMDIERNNSFLTINHPSRHLSEDVKRQIFFIDSNKDWLEKECEIKEPNHIGFGIIQIGFSHTKNFKDLFNALFKKINPENMYDFSKLLFATASLYAYVYPQNTNIEKTNLLHKLLEKIDSLKPLNGFINFLESHEFNVPTTFAVVLDNKRPVKIDDYKIPETISFLKFIYDNFTPGILSFSRYTNPLSDYRKLQTFNPVEYQLNFDYAGKFLHLYLNHLERYVTKDYLYFESLKYSTGEISLLNLFSRLPFIQTNVLKDFDRFNRVRFTKTNNLVLILDEGESYFHPQWQKKFLKLLTQFVSKLFVGKSVQIIITSHSPIFLSDLPSKNIIYMDRDDYGRGVNITSQINQETFAANIYSLYANSFFLKNGMIGDFALKKLKEVTHELSSESKLSKDRIIEIKKIISLIGEPVWKAKFIEMLNNKE